MSITQLIGVAVALGFSLLIAFLAGVFKPGSVNGPKRLGDGERVGTIWYILAIGLFTWFFIPAVYTQLALSPPAQNSSTSPATMPALSQTETVAVNIAAETGVLISLIAATALLRRDGLRRLGLAGVGLARTARQAAAGVAIVLPLVFVSVLFTQFLWDLIGYEHPNAHELLRILGHEANGWMRLVVIISAVVIAPVAEETLFRGHLQTALSHTFASSPTARWTAIISTSLLFMSVHETWSWPPIFLLSICLGYAYERTGNLWVAILIHALFNAANVVTFVMQQQAS